MTTETKRKLSKGLAKFVVKSSAAATTGAVIKNALPEATTTRQTVQFAIGVAAFSAMAGQAAGRWAGLELDELFESWDEFRADTTEETTDIEAE